MLIAKGAHKLDRQFFFSHGIWYRFSVMKPASKFVFYKKCEFNVSLFITDCIFLDLSEILLLFYEKYS